MSGALLDKAIEELGEKQWLLQPLKEASCGHMDCVDPIHMYIYIYLVGGLEHFLFSHILGIIIPID